jgi:hypothetical protein
VRLQINARIIIDSLFVLLEMLRHKAPKLVLRKLIIKDQPLINKLSCYVSILTVYIAS